MRAFLFPGQGSQQVGMAADLFRTDAAFCDLVQVASTAAGEDLERVCLRGPDKLLRRTPLLQPLLVAVSLGYLRQLSDRGVRPAVVLGHSLGEITALAAAGVVPFEEAIIIAAKRGALMEQAATPNGGMLAVTTTHREAALAAVAALAENLPVAVANDNAPSQFVLSGDRDALTQVGHQLTVERLGRCQPLPVSGPWHSPLMAPAREAFRAWVADRPFGRPHTTLILNATGAAETDPERIKHHVTETLAGPVQWRQCLETLKTMRPRQLCEVGPGRVLAGLARANGFDARTEVLGVSDLRGVALAAGQTEGGGK